MKKLFILGIIICSAISCKDNPTVKKANEVKDNISNTTKAARELNRMQEDIQDLQEQEPLTNEDLKKWLPEELKDMKRTSYRAGQLGMASIASIEATYQEENSDKKLNVRVIDGAGQMGASMTAGVRMMLSQDFEEDSNRESRRTIKKKGMKVIETYRKNSNDSKLEFLHDDRFFVSLEGDNMDLDELWDRVDELDFDDLI